MPREDTDVDLRRVAAAAEAVLRQCSGYLNSLPDASYTAASDVMMGGTIGQHVRHALDHFAAALRAADGDRIDYDRRERDTPIESDRAAASRQISDLADRLGRLGVSELQSSARVRVMLSGEGDEATLESTLARELAFASHHAVHHFAMIGVIGNEKGAPPPPGFGKAPSTLHHERARA
jgi:uncharacterized damage-inducible protein DinB